MFDNEKEMTLEGTIKEFQWTNPHTWTQVLVKDASGKEVEWSIEGGSPNSLSRAGWKRTSIKPGDQATLVIHPLKNGFARRLADAHLGQRATRRHAARRELRAPSWSDRAGVPEDTPAQAD